MNVRWSGILPVPPHVTYDLGLPASCGKMVQVGNRLAFTHASPLLPLRRRVAETPWIWAEAGPVVWLVDIWWNKKLLTPMKAMRLFVDVSLDLGILHDGEEVFFHRNYGRYGRGVARRRGS